MNPRGLFLALVVVGALTIVFLKLRGNAGGDAGAALKRVETELLGTPAAAPPQVTFAETVAKHFPTWAHDSLLTGARTDELLRSPAVKGDEAAALAAIHSCVFRPQRSPK